MFEIDGKQLQDGINFLNKNVGVGNYLTLEVNKDNTVKMMRGDEHCSGYYLATASKVSKAVDFRIEGESFSFATGGRKNLKIWVEDEVCHIQSGRYHSELKLSKEEGEKADFKRSKSDKYKVYSLKGEQKEVLEGYLGALSLVNPFDSPPTPLPIFLRSKKGTLVGGANSKWHGVWRQAKAKFEDFELTLPSEYVRVLQNVLNHPSNIKLMPTKKGFEIFSEIFWLRLPAIGTQGDLIALESLVKETQAKPVYKTAIKYETFDLVLSNMGAIFEEGALLSLTSKDGQLNATMKTNSGVVKDTIKCDIKSGLNINLEMKTLNDVLNKLKGDFIVKVYGSLIRLDRDVAGTNTCYFLSPVKE